MVANLIAMVATLIAMVANLIDMVANLIAMVANLIDMVSNLIAMVANGRKGKLTRVAGVTSLSITPIRLTDLVGTLKHGSSSGSLQYDPVPTA
jgi:hypothetical protein